MKIIVWVLVAIILVLLISLCYIQKYHTYKYLEKFENQPVPITYYVIHNRANQERTKNIKEQEAKLGKPIHIFDAIMGKDLDLDNLSAFDKRLQNKYNSRNKNEYGCYLSHFMLLKIISEHISAGNPVQDKQGYTVIFEDDFQIMSDDLEKHIRHDLSIIDKDIDMIFLGHLDSYVGTPYKEDLYDLDMNNYKDFAGLHGFVIPNQSIQKIHDMLFEIDNPIDYKYGRYIGEGKLNALIVNPTIVNQNGMESGIGFDR